MNARLNEQTNGRGFASMDRSRQRQIASQGGRAAHQQGTAHEFTSEEARVAGRKGGEAVSANREHMAQIGRKGGEASRGRSASSHRASETEQNGSALNDAPKTNGLNGSSYATIKHQPITQDAPRESSGS